ncbi:threonine/serine dehydratase [Maribius pontilimi]|uniref:Threonine/serine dehydratase n=1 Tax=Palleronia pontilimi TaxID=1964209 RepID=A0A934IGK1_9RHOB|nr:threonine/serine dehydratase [Palleronia pontilimi]
MNIDEIHAARDRLAGHARRTPLLSSPFLDELAGRRVLVKAECLQHTGSFKFRGAWSAISALDPDVRARGVLAYSSGNHAQGVARAAQIHGCPAVIVMPADAPALKIANTRGFGAEVVLYDRARESREEIGGALASERGLTLIPPYDHPMVIAGQASCGIEIAEDLPDTTADVLVCCGGGGLTSGMALAFEHHAPGLRVRPTEPDGFDDMARSLQAGEIRRNSSTTGSICDAILTPAPGDLTFPILNRLAGPGLTVSDDQAMHAMALAFKRLKLVAEPGGAVALAAALFRADEIVGDTVVCVISGGNVDPALFAEALGKFGDA